jgi:hypothetical protein
MIVNKCLSAIKEPIDLIFDALIELIMTTTNLIHNAWHSANISNLPVDKCIWYSSETLLLYLNKWYKNEVVWVQIMYTKYMYTSYYSNALLNSKVPEYPLREHSRISIIGKFVSKITYLTDCRNIFFFTDALKPHYRVVVRSFEGENFSESYWVIGYFDKKNQINQSKKTRFTNRPLRISIFRIRWWPIE